MPNASLGSLVDPFNTFDTTTTWSVGSGTANFTPEAGRLRATGTAATSYRQLTTQALYDATDSAVAVRFFPAADNSFFVFELRDTSDVGMWMRVFNNGSGLVTDAGYGLGTGSYLRTYGPTAFDPDDHVWFQIGVSDDDILVKTAPDDGGVPDTWEMRDTRSISGLAFGYPSNMDVTAVRVSFLLGSFGGSTATYAEIDGVNTTTVSLGVSPSSVTLSSTGATQQLTVSGATGMVAWDSSDTDVATVSSTGLVTAVASGSATITATDGANGATGVCTVTVEIAPVIDVDDSPVLFTAPFGGATPAAVARDVTNGNGGTLDDLVATIMWESGEPEGWLSAQITNDEPPDLVLTPSLVGLPSRTYEATVTLTATDADPVAIPVTLGVRPVDASEPVHATPYDDDFPDLPLPASSVQYSVEPQGVVSVDAAVTLRAIQAVLEPTDVTLTVTIDGQTTSSTFTVYPHDG